SLISFWSGSFINSFVLAKMKIWTQGKWLWTRTIGSTVVGEFVDSGLFYTIAFWGIMTTDQIITVALTQYVLKTSWEILATPLTYWVVARLKRAENEDYYDSDTNFTPFSLKV
ncbi:VUT family protein, partial [uncultured Limnobacter sp.]|uniref:VUT family protein n=1 Tax=uncultured Limnobacter sp. TaxID=199681 RepID=UPI0030FA89DE